MIYEGMIEEGLRHHQGRPRPLRRHSPPADRRNPWNEIECGGHYARAMSSWSMLLAASGYEYDGAAKSAAVHAAGHAREVQVVLRRAGRLGLAGTDAKRWQAMERNSCGRGAICGREDFAGPAGRRASELTIIRSRKVNGHTVIESIVVTPKSEADGVLVDFGDPIPIGADESLTFNFS